MGIFSIPNNFTDRILSFRVLIWEFHSLLCSLGVLLVGVGRKVDLSSFLPVYISLFLSPPLCIWFSVRNTASVGLPHPVPCFQTFLCIKGSGLQSPNLCWVFCIYYFVFPVDCLCFLQVPYSILPFPIPLSSFSSPVGLWW